MPLSVKMGNMSATTVKKAPAAPMSLSHQEQRDLLQSQPQSEEESSMSSVEGLQKKKTTAVDLPATLPDDSESSDDDHFGV